MAYLYLPDGFDVTLGSKLDPYYSGDGTTAPVSLFGINYGIYMLGYTGAFKVNQGLLTPRDQVTVLQSDPTQLNVTAMMNDGSGIPLSTSSSGNSLRTTPTDDSGISSSPSRLDGYSAILTSPVSGVVVDIGNSYLNHGYRSMCIDVAILANGVTGTPTLSMQIYRLSNGDTSQITPLGNPISIPCAVSSSTVSTPFDIGPGLQYNYSLGAGLRFYFTCAGTAGSTVHFARYIQAA